MTDNHKKVIGFYLSPEIAVLVLLVVFSSVRAFNYGQQYIGIDFYQFWAVGQIVNRDKHANIYTDTERRKMGSELLQNAEKHGASANQIAVARNRQFLETFSTPLLYTTFSWFSTGDYPFDFRMFHIFSVLCFLFAIVSLSHFAHLSPWAGMAMGSLLLGWFGPLLSDLRVANVNAIQLALLTLFLLVQTRRKWPFHQFIGGLILGFAVMFKPNIIFVVIALGISRIINRRHHQLASMMMGIIIAATICFIYTSIYFGSPGIWYGWLHAVWELANNPPPVGAGNYSFSALSTKFLGLNLSALFTVFFIFVTTLFVWLGRRGATESEQTAEKTEDHERFFEEDMLMVACGCLIYLLSAPLVWYHYFVLTIPMLIISLQGCRSSQSGDLWRDVSRYLLPTIALTGLALEPIKGIFSGNADFSHYVAYTMVACTLMLFGMAHRRLWQLRERTRTPSPTFQA